MNLTCGYTDNGQSLGVLLFAKSGWLSTVAQVVSQTFTGKQPSSIQTFCFDHHSRSPLTPMDSRGRKYKD